MTSSFSFTRMLLVKGDSMRKLFPIISLVILIGTVAGCSTGNSTAKPDPTDSTTQPAKEEFDAIAAMERGKPKLIQNDLDAEF